MARSVTTFAWLMLLFPASQLFGIDVCLVNDSDRTTIVTVISGSERFEKRLGAKSHAFVSIADTKDDRVVIAQTIDESSPDKLNSAIRVVDTKVLTEHVNRLNFCYVHGTVAEGLRLELLAFVCLDIVPQRWGHEPADERFRDVRSALIKSLKNTTELKPESNADLKEYVRQFVFGKPKDTVQ